MHRFSADSAVSFSYWPNIVAKKYLARLVFPLSLRQFPIDCHQSFQVWTEEQKCLVIEAHLPFCKCLSILSFHTVVISSVCF